MNTALLDSHTWYENHRDEIVKRHNGRYVVVAGRAVVGDYATEGEALGETLKTRGAGTFLVKHCIPKSEEAPIFFHSRVSFA